MRRGTRLRAAFQLGMGGCTALCLLPATPRACADAAPAWRAAGRSCLSARTRGAAARGARRLRAGGCAARRSISRAVLARAGSPARGCCCISFPRPPLPLVPGYGAGMLQRVISAKVPRKPPASGSGTAGAGARGSLRCCAIATRRQLTRTRRRRTCSTRTRGEAPARERASAVGQMQQRCAGGSA